jgi:hypothetical protein
MATAQAQKTREIAKEQWGEFLDSLSREHRGETVTVQFTDPDLGYQIEMRQIPLVGVSADLKAGGGPRIEVMVGRTDFEHTTHSVFEPRAVRLEEDDQGAPAVLELEAASGSKTLVMLKPAAFGEAGEVVPKK